MQTYINEFRAHMASFGLQPEEIVGDGQIHRFDANGRRDKSCWFVLYVSEDGAGGAFGDWAQMIDEKWSSFKPGVSGSPSKMAEIMAKIEDSKRQADEARKAKAKQAAEISAKIWDGGGIVDPEHPYLIKKQIKGVGLRMELGTRNLIVPMYAPGRRLVGLQRIMEDGSKRFLPGSSKKGSCSIIKGAVNDRVYVCEGYATAETVFMATGRTVFIAFDAGNLLPVCKQIMSKTKVPVIVCGDDDVWTVLNDGTPYNSGRIHAMECHDKLGCNVIFPEFTNTASKPSDFNDLMCLEGVCRVEAITSIPWADKRTVLQKRIKEWAVLSSGKFSTFEIDRELGIISNEDKQIRSDTIMGLLRDGTLERDDNKRGVYRARDHSVNVIDLNAAGADDNIEFWLPFDLYTSVALKPRNIVMVAGEANAGKTTLALETLKANLEMYWDHPEKKFFYITSEMSAAELKSNLRRFGTIEDFERCIFIDRQFEPYDLIKQNKEMQDGFVFIDFLETRGGDYSKTVSEVQKIYDALGDGIAVLLVQKQPGKDHAKGGSGMLEKPRLAINLEKRFKSDVGTVCIANIAKCKSVHRGQINPDGKSVYYLVDRSGTHELTTWGYIGEKAKESTDASLKEQIGVSEMSGPVIFKDRIEEILND